MRILQNACIIGKWLGRNITITAKAIKNTVASWANHCSIWETFSAKISTVMSAMTAIFMIPSRRRIIKEESEALEAIDTVFKTYMESPTISMVLGNEDELRKRTTFRKADALEMRGFWEAIGLP